VKVNINRNHPWFCFVISGIRGAGNSTLLRQIIKNEKSFHYLNFEDIRIFGFEAKDFTRLNEILIIAW